MVGHNREPCLLERVCEALCCVAISHVDDLDELVELREGRRIARGHAKTRVVGLSSTTVLHVRIACPEVGSLRARHSLFRRNSNRFACLPLSERKATERVSKVGSRRSRSLPRGWRRGSQDPRRARDP